MQGEPLIYRKEVEAMLFSLVDINANLKKLVRLLEDEYGEEEEEDFDDDA